MAIVDELYKWEDAMASSRRVLPSGGVRPMHVTGGKTFLLHVDVPLFVHTFGQQNCCPAICFSSFRFRSGTVGCNVIASQGSKFGSREFKLRRLRLRIELELVLSDTPCRRLTMIATNCDYRLCIAPRNRQQAIPKAKSFNLDSSMMLRLL